MQWFYLLSVSSCQTCLLGSPTQLVPTFHHEEIGWKVGNKNFRGFIRSLDFVRSIPWASSEAMWQGASSEAMTFLEATWPTWHGGLRAKPIGLRTKPPGPKSGPGGFKRTPCSQWAAKKWARGLRSKPPGATQITSTGLWENPPSFEAFQRASFEAPFARRSQKWSFLKLPTFSIKFCPFEGSNKG